MKNLDCDIHDRWVKDPVVKEILEKHEENIKKAGHDLSDKPISDIIPQKSLDKLKRKPVKIESNKFEESFQVKHTIPDQRSQAFQDNDSDAIPSSMSIL